MESKKIDKRVIPQFITTLFLVLIDLVIIIWRLSYGPIEAKNLISFVVEFTGMVIFTVFIGGSMISGINDKESTHAFSMFLNATCINLFLDSAMWILDGVNIPFIVVLGYVFNSMFYLGVISILFFFSKYLLTIVKNTPKWADKFMLCLKIYFVILCIAVILNLKYGFIFTIVDGVYQRTIASRVTFIISQIFTFVLFVDICVQKIDRTQKRAIIIYMATPIVTMVAQIFYPKMAIGYFGLCISIPIMYIEAYVRQGYMLHNNIIELQRQRMATMISQIQPHFVNNTLSTIACLCRKDPETAEEVTLNFAKYLRQNINILQYDDNIPFEQELEHTKTYLSIEKIRFADHLNIEYDIKILDFFIPSLTVQPLVENAVKHGIRKKDGAGTLKISTYETDHRYVIKIVDDGVGFDKEKLNMLDGSHIGIPSVASCLRHIANAELIIESEVGKGTTMTIELPKGEK